MRTQDDDLVRFVYAIQRGPKFTVQHIAIADSPSARTSRIDQAWSNGDSNRHRPGARGCRYFLCQQGYADAEVQVQQDRRGNQVDLTFIKAGHRSTVTSFDIIGTDIPSSTVKKISIKAGSPYCPKTVNQRLHRLRTELQEQSYLTAVVTPTIERKGSQVRIKFRARDLKTAVIARIWFEGQKVTHEHVWTTITLKRGDKVRPSPLAKC